MKTGGGLHEIRSCVGRGAACVDQSLLIAEAQQRRRFDDHLEDRGVSNGITHRGDVLSHGVEIAGKRRADVDHHVDLLGSCGHGELRFVRFDSRKMFA